MEALAPIIELVQRMGDGPFRAVILLVLWFGVRQLTQMRKSMEKLNTSLAVVIERTSNHEKRITRLEKKK